MTEKNSLTGEITIRNGAFRPDLEVTPINAGDWCSAINNALARAHDAIRSIGLTVPSETDASEATCISVGEIEELIINIKTRLSSEPPQTTLIKEANAKN